MIPISKKIAVDPKNSFDILKVIKRCGIGECPVIDLLEREHLIGDDGLDKKMSRNPLINFR